MNKKILGIFVALVAMAILITPAFAKTKTEVKVNLVGHPIGNEDKLLITPNGKIQRDWGTDGEADVTLYESDGVTIIDTFTDTDELYRMARDSNTNGFLDGVLVAKLEMVWQSETLADSGFTGFLQWRGIDGPPTDLKGVFHGFGAYEGQTLKLEGQFLFVPGQIPPHHEYNGILIS